MTRRLRVVAEDEVPAVQCLLCGEAAESYADLCDHCALVFQVCADRVAAAVVAALQPAADVVQVPGQLELDEAGRCALHGWTHRFRPCDQVGQ